MKVTKTKDGFLLSKGTLTKESKWPHPVVVECEKGCETPVDQLKREVCDEISRRLSIKVESTNPGLCNGDIAVDNDLYREIHFEIQPK